jgi:uroporphyrinogen-III synthase
MANLNGLEILVTRPPPEGLILCEQINLAGGHAIYFPVMTIEPLSDPAAIAALNENIKKLDTYDWLIFISPQAVYQSNMVIRAQWSSLPANIKIAAIGGGTAQVLEQIAGYKIDYCPAENWGSEAFLSAPEFQSIAKKRIAIIKGEGGREILSDTLKARGAVVTEIIVYRRCMTNLSAQPYLDLLAEQKIDRIICTSNQILEYVKKLLQEEWDQLKRIPLIVVSERMQKKAQQEGFEHIVLAKNASINAMITILQGDNIYDKK